MKHEVTHSTALSFGLRGLSRLLKIASSLLHLASLCARRLAIIASRSAERLRVR
jgi:hypothetical protein